MSQNIKSFILNNVIVSVINLIFVGVIVTCWLTPWVQRHSQEKEVYYNKRIELTNNFVMDFTLYRLNRQRLIYAGLEQVKGAKRGWRLDKEFYNNKEMYRTARDTYRDKVYRDLQLATLFFSTAVVDEGKKFIAWDSSYAARAAQELPNDADMDAWQNSITRLMKNELSS